MDLLNHIVDYYKIIKIPDAKEFAMALSMVTSDRSLTL